MILLLLIIGFCSDINSSQLSDKPEWKSLGQSMAATFSYDARHIEKLPQGYLRAQFRLIYRTDTEEGRKASEQMREMTTPAMEGKPVKPVAYGIIAVEIECVKRRFRLRQEAVYTSEGELIEAVRGLPKPEWVSASPGNMYTMLVEEVCGSK